MCPVLSSQGLNQNWQQLYKTALFETNRNKVAERIAEAERVIAAPGAGTSSRNLQT